MYRSTRLALLSVSAYCAQNSTNPKVKDMALAIERESDDWTIDKLGRWVGFMQGIMYMDGELDIEVERNRTRPIFHQAYQEDGFPVPKSVSV